MLLAATWITAGVNSPTNSYKFGIINNNPCDAVNVVHKVPAAAAPCNAPAAPASDCIIDISTVFPNIFFFSETIIASIFSPIADDGDIGYKNEVSDNA